MLRWYILRRVLLIFPTLLLVSFLIFSIVRVLPGDVVAIMIAEQGYAENEEELRKTLGLDRPLIVQYVVYLKNVLKGDLGKSLWSGKPVAEELSRRLPTTLRLGIMALIWTVLLGVPIGVLSALYQDRWIDYLLRSLAIGGLSIPGFWIATLILVFGAIWFRWVPPMDYVPFSEDPWKSLSQLIVPSLILSIALSAAIMRMTRTMMLEVMKEDYIRQGPFRLGGGDPSCPEKRPHPGSEHHGHPGGRSDRRDGHHGKHLRPPRHGQVPTRRHLLARLPGHPGYQSLHLHLDRLYQSNRGPALWTVRSPNSLSVTLDRGLRFECRRWKKGK